MSLTGFFAAALVAVLVALAFVLIPLLGSRPERRALRRRLAALEELSDELEPEDYRARRERLEEAIGQTEEGSDRPRWALIAGLAVAVPMATWLMYQTVGEPDGITPGDSQVEQIRGLMRDVARRVEREPNNIDHWVRLGLIYKDLTEYSSAEHALRRALYIDPNNAFIQVELAETLLFASEDARLPDVSRALLERALTVDPGNQKGLWLLGMGAFQAGDYRRAIEQWQRLDGQLEAGSVQDSVRQQIQRARAALAGNELPDERLPPDHPPIDDRASSAADGPGFMVDLSIDPELAAGLSGNETVFLIARAAQGPAAPLAVERLQVADLPASVTLRDSDAMVEGLNLSAFPNINLTARVSMAGTAEAQPGDLEGRIGPVSILDVAAAQVRIDTILE